ncbi:MAG: polysaccharide deacetylase family protein [Gemmatimonadota bacterium]
MPPKANPVPRARSALHWLGGLLLLGFFAAGVTSAAVLLWENVDIQRLARTAAAVAPESPPPALPPSPAAVPPVSFEAALFVSEASAAFFPDSSFYPRVLRSWESRLAEAGARVRRISKAGDVLRLPADVLVVAPDAVCLARGEVDALRRHVGRGGGLVIDWATGARDERCNWVGWEPVRSLTGAIDVVEIEPREALFLTLPAGLPLSAGLDPGSRVELRPEAHLALLATGAHVYWSDWALNPAPARDGPEADAAAILRSAPGGGRVVWLGFRESQAVTDRDREIMGTVMRNGLRWGVGVPFAEIAPWPDTHGAALLILEDVESGFTNAALLAELARQKGVPVAFFPVSGLARQHPELAAAMTAVGEVGSQTSDHRPVAGLPYSEQALRLRRSWSELREWSGRQPRGLRPPEERFDENTLRAWKEAGGSYVVAVNNARSAAPEVFRTPAGRVVLLSRLVKDDYNVFVQESAIRRERLGEAYLAGMRKLRALGGLAVLALHSQIGGTEDRLDVVGEAIDSARADGGWWLATGSEIADWWAVRHGADLAVGLEAGELELRVSAPPDGTLSGAWLEVYLPDAEADLRPYAGDQPLPYAVTEWGLRLPVEALAPGTDQRIRLRPAEPIPEPGEAS